jgi:hypothetical protein
MSDTDTAVLNRISLPSQLIIKNKSDNNMGNWASSKTPAEEKSCATRVAEAVARAASSNDIGKKISTVYQLVQELKYYSDEQLSISMVTKLAETNIDINEFLNLVQ